MMAGMENAQRSTLNSQRSSGETKDRTTDGADFADGCRAAGGRLRGGRGLSPSTPVGRAVWPEGAARVGARARRRRAVRVAVMRE